MVHGWNIPCGEPSMDPAVHDPQFHPEWAAHEASTIGILLHVKEEEGGLLSGKYGISINFYSVQCQHYCQPINVLKH